MFTTKDVTEKVQSLREKYPTGNESAVLSAWIDDAIREYNVAIHMVDQPSDEERKRLLQVARTAVAYYNGERINARIAELKGMAYADAMIALLESQVVTGKKLHKQAGVDDYEVVADEKVALPVADVIHTMAGATGATITDLCCIFANNCATFAAKSDEKQLQIARKALSDSYMELRHRYGWDVKASELSLTKLAAQLTELCNVIFHKAAPAKMLNCDVRWIMQGIISTTDKANEGGKYQLKMESTVLSRVFRAAYTRKKNLPYAEQNATRISQPTLSRKENADMAEAPFKPEPETVATDVTPIA